jgi:hypothetical protein
MEKRIFSVSFLMLQILMVVKRCMTRDAERKDELQIATAVAVSAAAEAPMAKDAKSHIGGLKGRGHQSSSTVSLVFKCELSGKESLAHHLYQRLPEIGVCLPLA